MNAFGFSINNKRLNITIEPSLKVQCLIAFTEVMILNVFFIKKEVYEAHYHTPSF